MKFNLDKTRQSVLEIDLDALRTNFNYFENLLQADTRFIIVIKAFAYGAGIKNIASVFEGKPIAYLAVACIDEGMELKDAGIQQKIMVLNAEVEGYQELIEYGLEPVLYDFRTLQLFKAALKKYKAFHKPYPVHIKLNTGMNRLGFDPDDLQQLGQELLHSEQLKVETCFTHLTGSGSKTFDDFTQLQTHSFEKACEYIQAALGYSVKRHILNSNGIERFHKAQFEMVRLGIGLYGFSAVDFPLASVYAWRTRIVQLKTVKKGDSVSYNRSWIAQRESKIATVFIGYADGFNRKLSRGKWQLKKGDQYFPVVGDICMDLCMIDVTDSAIEIGDIVTIFDTIEEVNKMAEILDTINYEVLTSISKRVKRVYLNQ